MFAEPYFRATSQYAGLLSAQNLEADTWSREFFGFSFAFNVLRSNHSFPKHRVMRSMDCAIRPFGGQARRRLLPACGS